MVSTLVSICFGNLWLRYTIKTNCETSECWPKNMLKFNFLKKSLKLDSPSHLLNDFSREILFIFYLLTHQISLSGWLSLLIKISGNMWIVIVCYPVYYVMNFETYLRFLVKVFSYMTKNSEQNFSEKQRELLRWNKKHFLSFLIKIIWDQRVKSLFSVSNINEGAFANIVNYF